jgi:hypothetical protein
MTMSRCQPLRFESIRVSFLRECVTRGNQASSFYRRVTSSPCEKLDTQLTLPWPTTSPCARLQVG